MWGMRHPPSGKNLDAMRRRLITSGREIQLLEKLILIKPQTSIFYINDNFKVGKQ
jgi:hypothetical protein